MDLTHLDAQRGGPMNVRVAGRVVTLKPATEIPWRVLVIMMTKPAYFLGIVWSDEEARLPVGKIGRIMEAWRIHNGLPPTEQLRRLIYMCERYGDGIEYDLQAHLGLSFGELWRDRKWREILNYIDHLPTNSQMNHLLTNDEEYLEEVMSHEKPGDSGGYRPSMSDWSLTNSLLATLIDAVNRNSVVTQAVAGGKGPKPTVTPFPRPLTAADTVRYRLDKKRHEEMNAILLRGRDDRG